jgi:hypothetical protein
MIGVASSKLGKDQLPERVRAQGVGLAVGPYLFYLILEFPVTSVALANIVYVSPHF